MTNWFVKRLVYTYLFGDFLCTLVEPCLLLYIVHGGSQYKDSYSWAKSLLILVNVFYLLEVGIQQLLILLFYYRLERQQSNRLHGLQHSIMTASDVDLESEDPIGHSQISDEKITLLGSDKNMDET